MLTINLDQVNVKSNTILLEPGILELEDIILTKVLTDDEAQIIKKLEIKTASQN